MLKTDLRVLTYTNLFPNHIKPNSGIFIKHRMKTFMNEAQAELDVVAPVPYFPKLPWRTRWADASRIRRTEVLDGLRIYHPRYLVIPKLGMRTHGSAMYWATRRLVCRLHRERRYDLIDAHWIYPDGWAAVNLAKVLDLPVVLSARGNDINEYIDLPAIRPLIVWSLQQCDHIISVCQALKDMMVSLGIAESKVSVVGNGVDVDTFYPIPKAEARNRLGLPGQGQILLSVGLLEPRKGHHLVIEALHLLHGRSGDRPRLYIVGEGLFRKQLKDAIVKFGLQNSVTLVGEVSNHALVDWYSAADVLCLASDREGWPNVLLESIACGTPVVATSVFGTPEVVTSDDVGLLVETRSAEALASQLTIALEKRWNTTKLAKFASQRSWSHAAQSVHDIFRTVLQHRA